MSNDPSQAPSPSPGTGRPNDGITGTEDSNGPAVVREVTSLQDTPGVVDLLTPHQAAAVLVSFTVYTSTPNGGTNGILAGGGEAGVSARPELTITEAPLAAHANSVTPVTPDNSLHSRTVAVAASFSTEGVQQGATTSPARKYVDDVLNTDVLCGRGEGSNLHPGNIQYRKVINLVLGQYSQENTTRGKAAFARRLMKGMELIYNSRFLAFDEVNDKWYIEENRLVLEKIKIALRDNLRYLTAELRRAMQMRIAAAHP